jgi:hypothetical protein
MCHERPAFTAKAPVPQLKMTHEQRSVLGQPRDLKIREGRGALSTVELETIS